MNDSGRDSNLESLLEAHRFGEVGRCVNSVAHDGNNALGVILAYADLIGMEPGINGESRRMLDEIIAATRRASDQLSWLTEIARPAPAGKNPAKPSVVIDRAVAMRHYEANRLGIQIETTVGEDLPEVSIEIPAIERALIHLLVNAMDAAAECDEKRISFEAEVADGGVSIYVLDTADPVAADVAERMFEPFYTTKGANHLGLGLCAAWRAAEASGGTLTYEPGRGFCLALPLA